MTYPPFAVAAPVANVWDVAAITAAALAVLRLDPGDVDAGRVAAGAEEATMRIDLELDAVDPVDTTGNPLYEGPATSLAVTLYRDKDFATGVSSSFTPDRYEPVGGDPAARVRKSLVKLKVRFGCG
jgi:hypothetical protein